MTIDIKNSILIKRDAKTIFEYVSNYENDKYWRKIIHETKADNLPLKIGTRLAEHSFLSRKYPTYTTVFKCVDFQPQNKVSCESTAENLFWTKNTRSVEVIDATSCKFNYHFMLDVAIVKYALGFSLPYFMIKISTQIEMKSYLKELKKVLENKVDKEI